MLLKRRSEKIERLKKVPLFAGLGQGQLRRIEQAADEVSIDAGKELTRQGTLGRECFLILRGKARVERSGRLIDRLGAGDCFGEMSLIDRQPRSATVIAETPLTLLVLDPRSFSALLDDVPELTKKLLLAMCARLRKADEKLATRN